MTTNLVPDSSNLITAVIAQGEQLDRLVQASQETGQRMDKLELTTQRLEQIAERFEQTAERLERTAQGMQNIGAQLNQLLVLTQAQGAQLLQAISSMALVEERSKNILKHLFEGGVVLHPVGERAPNFPVTLNSLLTLPDDQLNDLLQFYHLSQVGTTKEKCNRFLEYIGYAAKTVTFNI